MARQVSLFGDDDDLAPSTITQARVVAMLDRLRYRAERCASEAVGTYWLVDDGVELISAAGEYLTVEIEDGRWSAGSEPVATMEDVERVLALEPRRSGRRRRLAVLGQTELPDPELEPWFEEVERLRPTTWGECLERIGDELCPFVRCKRHLYSDSAERQRLFEIAIEDLHPDDLGETCAQRVARSVEVSASEGGKWVGHSAAKRVPVGHPGPELVGSGSQRRWHQLSPEERNPIGVDAAVIGRFLGVSRELVRLEYNSGVSKLLADPAILAWAEALDLLGDGPLGLWLYDEDVRADPEPGCAPEGLDDEDPDDY